MDELRERVRSGASFGETPVAFIHPYNGNQGVLVTLTKPGTMLETFLILRNEHKLEASDALMRVLARVHAAGWSHGHPQPRNVLFQQNPPRPRLVDDKKMARLTQSPLNDAGAKKDVAQAIGTMANHYETSYSLENRKQLTQTESTALRAELTTRWRQTYERALQTELARKNAPPSTERPLLPSGPPQPYTPKRGVGKER